ncbi:bifunctional oligoribonuclease/PAP phosphatase NrnA [Kitasatospora sp. NBC_01287]|uniref:DHH family phosphoesterase n=1 Tax=Kitasatospora sp. NBC_01287 TaxID=2903573 RepID=UPI00225B075A|nr:bifunctional oligoribonuclease/PAP phosphatase NrnA [Kitasatospora sp. NBC_01287]MCX4746407.1 bifunctional oligoribonuclease/PAP phosphatase NrnA [Kitasatospora sp. NBC_01287]
MATEPAAAGSARASVTIEVTDALAVLPGQRAQSPLGAPPSCADGPAGAGFAEVWEQVLAEIGAAGEIDLVCHITPDGDALGSALAAGLALRSLGHRVRVSFGDDPQIIPDSLSFLPGQELIVPAAELPDRPELVICFDVASEGRLGLLREKAFAARVLVVLDHHASNPGFGTHRIIDPGAPATAVLVDELLRRLRVPLDQDIATCLYTGVASDTGSFKYPGTTPATHELAGRLLATGIRQDLISRRLWDTSSFGYLKVLAAALDRAVYEPDAAGGRGLVWTWVPYQDLVLFSVTVEEIEGLIDVLRKPAEAEVALVLKQDPDGTLRGSCRAKGAVDLAAVCAELGGGGHTFQAGFSLRTDVLSAVARFRAALG